MEVIIPILFVFYIIASVISAITKAVQKGSEGTQQTSRPKVPGTEDRDNQTRSADSYGEKAASDQSTSRSRPAVETISPTGGPTMIWDEQGQEPEESDNEEGMYSPDEEEVARRSWNVDNSVGSDTHSMAGNDDMTDDAWSDEWEWERPRTAIAAKATAQHPAMGAMNKKKLIEGIVWSEILKQPRGKKPWPHR